LKDMFNGIVEELGQVKRISRRGNISILEVKAEAILQDIRIGDSIAVNGACLTVIKKATQSLSFEVMPETLKVTNLGILKISDKVNLERSLKLGDRISGHFVSGHIDYIGTIRKKGYLNGNLCLEITVSGDYTGYLSKKGSVAVDGISLTIVNKKSNTFTVYIIPHTLKNTTLGFKGPSHKVNIELDVLAKYSKNPTARCQLM
jgi:riboflavin synthase